MTPAPPPVPPSLPTVLVVDDEPGIRQFIGEVLDDDGYPVRTAEDGIAALAELEQGGIDVVLADVCLPRLDGITLVRQVRQRYPTLPIVLMSALVMGPVLP